MKLTIEIPDEIIDHAFEDPHSISWCSVLVWNTLTRSGHCIERHGGPRDGKVRHKITPADIERAIRLMLTEGRPEIADVLRDDTDGPCRDLFLQYVVFGAMTYE